MSTHSALINLYQALGYQSNVEGLCHGFAVRWLEASLLGEYEVQFFEERINYIASKSTEELVKEIGCAAAKRTSDLTEWDHTLLDLRSFFDSLALFHRPDNWSSVIDNLFILQRQIEEISLIASSEMIKEKGGLKKLYSASFILTEAEIIDYLNNLGALLENTATLSKEPIALLLGNEDHSIGVIYYPGKGWDFRDINQDVEATKPVIRQSQQMAAAIKRSFAYSNHSAYTAFNVQILSTNSDPRCELLQNELQKFKSTYPITEEIANRQTSTINLLWIAVECGILEEVEALVAAGANVNQANIHGLTPVGLAAYGNDLVIIKLLAKAGANIHHVNNYGKTPVWIAASRGSVAALEFFAKAGANLNIINNEGMPPICIAARNGHTSVMEFFIKYKDKVELDQTDDDGATPIWLAAANGHAATIEVLAKAGANAEQACQGLTPTWIAAANGHAAALEVLAKVCDDLNIVNNEGIPPICVAAANGHTDVIEVFTQYKDIVDLNQADEDGKTAIFLAACRNHPATIQLLAKAGAKIDEVDNSGATPVWIAASKGHAAVVESLAQAGANLKIPYQQGIAPVCVAAFNGYTSVIEVLMQYKDTLDLNQATDAGETAIFLATINNHPDIIALLAKAGADINQADNKGATPIWIAALKGHAAAAEALAKADANLDQSNRLRAPPICIAAHKGHAEVVNVFIRAGANLNQTDGTGATPIWFATHRGHANIVNQLAQAGANVDAMCDGKTPLFIAAQNGDQETVEALLAARADFNIPLRMTAAELNDWAASAEYPMKYRLYSLANDKQEDELVSLTPMQIARIMGHFDIAKLIKEKCKSQKEQSVFAKRKRDDPSLTERHEGTDKKVPFKLRHKKAYSEKRRRAESKFFSTKKEVDNQAAPDNQEPGEQLGA